jgi:hypothetical protein
VLHVAPEGTATHAGDRLTLFRAVVNLFRLFRVMLRHGRLPPGVPRVSLCSFEPSTSASHLRLISATLRCAVNIADPFCVAVCAFV